MKLVLESCSTKEFCKEFGESEKLLSQLRDDLQDWLELQPHLPHDVPKKRLEWIILSTKMSLGRAKQRLDMYYTMRHLVPELFTNRDSRGHGIASLQNIMQYVMLPKLGVGKCRTFIHRITESDASKFCAWDVCKYLFMVADIRMIEDQNLGENYILDLSMVNLGHIIKVTPTLLKKCEIAAAKAYATRINGIHLVNAPPSVDRIMALIKTVLHPKLMARVHVHSAGDLESLYQFVPKSILPKDYGGDGPTMTELDAALRDKVDEWRDWFIEQEKILVNERLRPGPAFNEDNLFGFAGSFRKLEVD